MDCSITKNYLIEKTRLCSDDTSNCSKCPLSVSNNGHDIACSDFEYEHPEETIKIVQKWSDAHPCKVKTYLEDFLEKFPNAPMMPNREPCACTKSLYGIDCKCQSYSSCLKCWNQPMKTNRKECHTYEEK